MLSKGRRALLRAHVAALVAVMIISPMPSLLADKYNYTLSLLIFLLPSAVISMWFSLTAEEEIGQVKKAFLLTLALLVPMGVMLNLLFANSFFVYPDHSVVIGWYVPGFDFFDINPGGLIPVEEFAFYLSGFVTMLLLYIWGDSFFFKRDHKARAPRYRSAGSVVQLAWKPALAALSLFLAGWVYKALYGGPGFPGYLAYLLFIPFVVTFALYRVARPFINWQAFTLMLLYIVAMSVLWEVSLAIPGGWWGYQELTMVGLYIKRWTSLPVEAVLVWFLAAFATTVTFEAAKVFVYHPATSTAGKLFGKGRAQTPAPEPEVETALQ